MMEALKRQLEMIQKLAKDADVKSITVEMTKGSPDEKTGTSPEWADKYYEEHKEEIDERKSRRNKRDWEEHMEKHYKGFDPDEDYDPETEWRSKKDKKRPY